MSEIPDEVVERAARAIWESEFRNLARILPWADTDSEPERVRMKNIARAALRECGWAEMREALQPVANACTEALKAARHHKVELAPDELVGVLLKRQDMDTVITVAALSKAKGEGG